VKWTVAHAKGQKKPKSIEQIPRWPITSGWLALIDAGGGSPGVLAIPPQTGVNPVEVPLTDGRRALAWPSGNGEFAAYWAVDAADKPVLLVIDFDVFTQKEWKAKPFVKRAWLCLVIACGGSQTAPPPEHRPISLPDAAVSGGSGDSGTRVVIKRPFSLEILGLEPHGTSITPTLVATAKQFTTELCAAAREFGAIRVGTCNKEVIDEKLMANCEAEAPACMASIAKNLGVDRLIYGRMRFDVSYRVKLTLLVAQTLVEIQWTHEELEGSVDHLRHAAREAMASLLSRSP
jgi:hypothetical protein